VLPLATMRRLHDRGPGCRGLAVDTEGVMLGPDCALVRRTPRGYCAAAPEGIAVLQRAIFDDDARLSRLPIVLASIVRALERGDLVMAQLFGLEVPLDELDDDRLRRLSRVAGLIKGGFDPDQPRDEHGRWTSDAALHAITVGLGATSLFADVAPETLPALRVIAARINTATAVFQILFIPTNVSLISEGTLPDHPDITYHYDQGTGVLSLEHKGAPVFSSRGDNDGVFRDSDGRPIGRKIDGNLILDGDALPDAKLGSPGNKPDDKPKLCPDTTEESTEGRKERSIKISGLHLGPATWPGYQIDGPCDWRRRQIHGCRESDGTMLEAKGPGYLERLRENHPIVWRNIEVEFDKQADRQSRSALATSRQVEWHFAEEEVANYFRARWQGRFPNLTLIHTPMPSEP
jgi:hypothetical protein